MSRVIKDRPNRRNPVETRAALVLAAYNEMHRYGYQGMRVDAVLAVTGMGKGAFYHHFSSKRQLAFAVIDEIIAHKVVVNWTASLKDEVNPIDAITKTVLSATHNLSHEDIELGCPLCNLAQEMSPIDDEFRDRLARVHEQWVRSVCLALQRGQAKGRVKDGVNCARCAAFFVAALHGCIAEAKAMQNLQQLQHCAHELITYLDTLRA